jgi:CheY-like chemotaxis protein
MGATAMKGDQNDGTGVAHHWWRREPITAQRVARLRGPGWIVEGVLRDAHALHEGQEVRSPTWRPSRSSHHVLVVDDDRELLDLYSLALRAFGGCRVTMASDAIDALVKARRVVPDAIVTDFSMPVVDGGQLAEQLAADERTRRIPIVMVSGFAEIPEPVRRLCAAFVTKPCDPEELARVVTIVVAACEVA